MKMTPEPLAETAKVPLGDFAIVSSSATTRESRTGYVPLPTMLSAPAPGESERRAGAFDDRIPHIGYLMGMADAALSALVSDDVATFAADDFERDTFRAKNPLPCRTAFRSSDLYGRFDAGSRSTWDSAWKRGFREEVGIDSIDFSDIDRELDD